MVESKGGNREGCFLNTWGLQSNSRIGVTVSNGAVGGGFEYGTGVNVRKLYGIWNFGAGTLLVGQTYVPISIFLSNQVFDADADLLAWGAIYKGRRLIIISCIFARIRTAG